jgi:hypothetical protein
LEGFAPQRAADAAVGKLQAVEGGLKTLSNTWVHEVQEREAIAASALKIDR